MRMKALAVAMMAAVFALSFALVIAPDSDAYSDTDVVAIGETGYASLSEAVSALEDGEKITLLQDVHCIVGLDMDVIDVGDYHIIHDEVEVAAEPAKIGSIGHTSGTRCTICSTVIDGLEEVPAILPGSIEEVTSTGTVIEGAGTDTVSLKVEDSVISWSDADPSVGRYYAGWWVGVKLIADGSTDITNTKYSNNGGIEWKSFNQNKDSSAAPHYMYAWVLVNENFIENYTKEGILAYNYLFDWNGDGVKDQTFRILIDCTTLTLKDSVGEITYSKGEYMGAALVSGKMYQAMEEAVVAAGSNGTIVLHSDVNCVEGIVLSNITTLSFKINHTLDDGTITTEPTFTTKGVLTKSCTVCDYEEESEVQMVTLSDLIGAFNAIEGYTPVGKAGASSASVLVLDYDGSYTGTDVMNDLARFLGVLHDSGRVQALSYGNDGYTWNDSLGNQGSNWAKGETSLVSVLVEDFRNGVITNKVDLKLDDGTSFGIVFDAKFVAVVGDLSSKGTVTYSMLQDAVSQGGTVTLLSDVADTAAITIDRDVTVLGNNRTFAGTFVLSVSADGKPYDITIADLVMDGTSACAVSSDVKGVSLVLSKVTVKGHTASVDIVDAVSVSVTGSSFDASVKVTSQDAFDVTVDSLKFSIPAGKAFAMDGNVMTVSEASVEGIVRENVDVIVTSKATIPAGKTIEGTLWFDVNKDNGITMSSVTAGTSGVVLTKGSVEIIGDFIASEGTITVTGIARIVGDSTIDGIELVVPGGASLTVEEGASVTGTGSISNAGTVKVLGIVSTAMDNTADAVVQVSLTGSIDSSKLTGEGKVSFDSMIIRDIGTKYYRVGDRIDIPVNVDPATATLTIDYNESPSWVSIRDGHIVGIVAQDGSFNVTVKASMQDRETVSESFVINAVPGVDPDEPTEHVYTTKEIVKMAMIIIVVLVVICLVTRLFIG